MKSEHVTGLDLITIFIVGYIQRNTARGQDNL